MRNSAAPGLIHCYWANANANGLEKNTVVTLQLEGDVTSTEQFPFVASGMRTYTIGDGIYVATVVVDGDGAFGDSPNWTGGGPSNAFIFAAADADFDNVFESLQCERVR